MMAQILVLAKSIDSSWKKTRAILMLDSGVNTEEYCDRYKKLRRETARSAIQFYRLRERAAKRRSNSTHSQWRDKGYAGICAARRPAVVPAILPNTEPAMRPVPPG
jgi:hypothetical protein